MSRDTHELLTVLRKELEYLESGGYRKAAHTSWRPQFVFEDSPTCLNLESSRPKRPCSECAITEFVPEAVASKKFPCRYIPLNDQGETVDSYYRTGTRDDLEKTLASWLRHKIHELEAGGNGKVPDARAPEIHVKAKYAGSK